MNRVRGSSLHPLQVKAKLLGSQGVRVQDLLDEGGGVRNLLLQGKAGEAASLRLTTALTVEEGQAGGDTVDGRHLA